MNFKQLRSKLLEGTMEFGIFSDNPDEAEKIAQQLVMFMRKSKDIVVGDDKSQAYLDTIAGFIYDDELLDDLHPETGKVGKDANDIVVARLKKLGVNIH